MLLHLADALNAAGIVLASGSPRRRELLKQMGLACSVEPSRFDESSLDKGSYATAAAFVTDNASHKAREVAGRLQTDAAYILGADTVIVSPTGKIMEKPGSAEEAKAMLRLHSDNTHTVITGVAILYRTAPGQPWREKQFSSSARVTFAALSEAEIDAYVATGEPLDKAGGYGIQAAGGLFVKHLEGDYYAVVGLPLHALASHLAKTQAAQ